jgi:hypothetical protein
LSVVWLAQSMSDKHSTQRMFVGSQIFVLPLGLQPFIVPVQGMRPSTAPLSVAPFPADPADPAVPPDPLVPVPAPPPVPVAPPEPAVPPEPVAVVAVVVVVVSESSPPQAT